MLRSSAPSSCSVSATVNARSAFLISPRRPAMRSRWSRSEGSDRVASTRRSRSGAWSSSLSRSRSTAASSTSWKSSSTSTMGCWQRLELRYEGGKEGVAAPAARSGDGGDGRVGTLERGHDLGPEEPPRVGLGTEPEPREPMPGLASLRPARQQGRLAGTGRGGDQGERPLDGSGELLRQARALHHSRGNGRCHQPRGRTSSRSVGSAVCEPFVERGETGESLRLS